MNIYGSQGHNALCTSSLGSVTAAMKARRALAAAGISCDVIKVSSRNSERGCVYGIEYPCVLTGNVRTVLASAGMQAR